MQAVDKGIEIIAIEHDGHVCAHAGHHLVYAIADWLRHHQVDAWQRGEALPYLFGDAFLRHAARAFIEGHERCQHVGLVRACGVSRGLAAPYA